MTVSLKTRFLKGLWFTYQALLKEKNNKSDVGIIEAVINQLSICSEMITVYKTISATASNWRWKDAYEYCNHPNNMRLSERKSEIFLLVLSILAFIYAIVSIFHQMKSGFEIRWTSWIVLFYSLIIIFFLVKDWNKKEE
ncbi:hypothetical protein ON064_12215 [Planococcus sp. A6]|uniref:hypothetical protein n=1 Tax=Planococcus sp. A6 TaxID=2992760 RepID=UPI00237A8D7E|nr:hypothetical protein [Planococcus sp. A6]MDE0583795.1 hypothetical protein [Planococcus sp. A6]